MNKLQIFWAWYKEQGKLTLNQWRNQKFKPTELIYIVYGASMATFLFAWPIVGLKKAMFFSGSILVFLSTVIAIGLVASFVISPFERLYEARLREKSEKPNT